jgi:hypothetical protein
MRMVLIRCTSGDDRSQDEDGEPRPADFGSPLSRLCLTADGADLRSRDRALGVKSLGQDAGVSVFPHPKGREPGPRRNGEPEYNFLARVSGGFWDAVRDLIEDFVCRVESSAARADVTNRMRSGDDDQFASAWWEVYLHESLLRSDFDIEIHPSTTTRRAPDFLARRSGLSFYLEASSPGQPRAAKSAGARQSQLFSVLDRIDTGRYYLYLQRLQVGANPAPAAAWARHLKRWIDSLPTPSDEDLDGSPTMNLSHDDWLLEVSAIPGRAGSHRRAIGAYPMVFGVFDSAVPIRTALKKKYNAYGPLDDPLVIALNIRSIFHEDEAVESALFGTLAIEVSVCRPSASEPAEVAGRRWVRRPDGFWSTGDTWINEHVTGVLVGDDQAPYFTGVKQPTLWQHPKSELMQPPVPIWGLARVDDGRVVRSNPSDPRSFFDLPSPWPPGQRFPST